MISFHQTKFTPILVPNIKIKINLKRCYLRIPKLSHRIRALDNVRDPPWALTFDLKEKDTLWSPENKERLVRIIASDILDISREEMEKRVTELLILIPDLKKKISNMKPQLLADLINDIDKIALNLLHLKELFPKADISSMVSKRVEIILDSPSKLTQEKINLKILLKLDDVDNLICDFPLFLDTEAVKEVLEDIERLIKGDPIKHLLNNPNMLLSVAKGTKRLGEGADL